MLRQRILTAVISLPILIAAIWFGEPWFTIFITTAAILGSLEFFSLASHFKIQPLTYLGLISVLLLIISPHCPGIMVTPFIITLSITISLVWILFRSPKEQAFSSWAWTMAGILYIGWMLSHWIDLRNLNGGRDWVLWAMLATFASDTGAFFAGSILGKHSMVSAISPNKTWEGALGGVVFAAAISLILGISLSLPMTYWQMIFLGCLISIFAQLGDLVESLLKRNTGSKDAGKLLPGHGGFLDRLDSIIFTGVIVYYYAVFTMS